MESKIKYKHNSSTMEINLGCLGKQTLDDLINWISRGMMEKFTLNSDSNGGEHIDISYHSSTSELTLHLQCYGSHSTQFVTVVECGVEPLIDFLHQSKEIFHLHED